MERTDRSQAFYIWHSNVLQNASLIFGIFEEVCFIGKNIFIVQTNCLLTKFVEILTAFILIHKKKDTLSLKQHV
jgi:hypothetical protein